MCFFSEKCKKDKCFRYGILKKGEFIQSKSGVYKLLLNETGSLEIWCPNEKVWSTDTDKYIQFLYLGNDGLYLLGKDGNNRLNVTALDTLKQNADSLQLKQNADLLQMQNDGSLVIFDKNGAIAWKYTPGKKCGM